MTDWGALYAEHVEDLAALAAVLGEAELATAVPGSPGWTVDDVYAHLAGGPTDQIDGRTEGAPGPAWTARHVAERQGIPVEDLVAEMRSHVEAVAATLVDNPRPAVVWDIAVHHADLHEALGKHRLAEHLWAPIVPTLAPRLLGDLPISLDVDGTTYGAGGPAAEVSGYELFRALFSRRSRAQVRTWAGSLGAEQVDAIGVFGPRDDDQPVPVSPGGAGRGAHRG